MGRVRFPLAQRPPSSCTDLRKHPGEQLGTSEQGLGWVGSCSVQGHSELGWKQPRTGVQPGQLKPIVGRAVFISATAPL